MEMNIAIDTNAYRDFMRNDPSRVHLFRTAHHLYIPLIVLGELRAGLAAGKLQSTNAANLQSFLNTPRVSVLLPDEQTSHHYAQLYLYLRQHVSPIPTNDRWIASLVLQHQLVLCTSDVHFQNLPQLPRC